MLRNRTRSISIWGMLIYAGNKVTGEIFPGEDTTENCIPHPSEKEMNLKVLDSRFGITQIKYFVCTINNLNVLTHVGLSWIYLSRWYFIVLLFNFLVG